METTVIVEQKPLTVFSTITVVACTDKGKVKGIPVVDWSAVYVLFGRKTFEKLV